MNVAKRFRKGVAYTSIAHILNIILLFVGLAIAVRFVSPHEFGKFVLLSVVAQFLTMLADFGIRTAVVKFLSAETKMQGEIASTCIAASLFASAAILIVVWCLGDTLIFIFNLSDLTNLKLFVFFLFFPQHFQSQLTSFLQGLHLYGRFASVQVFGAGAKCLLILLLVMVFPFGFTGLMIATIGGTALSCLLAFILTPLRLVPQINLPMLRRLLSFGLPIQIGGFCGFVFERADAIMLGAFLGPVSVSIYEVGYKIPNQIRNFFEAFRSIFFPHLSHYYGKGDYFLARTELKTTLRLVSFAMTGLTLVALMYGRDLITLLFSATYAPSGAVFFILMIGISVGMANYFMGTALLASGRAKATLFASIPEALINVGINLLLIPGYGVIGAAWASTLSRVIVNPIFLIGSIHSSGIPNAINSSF